MRKLLIICSSSFYDRIPEVKEKLESDFEIILPNCYEDNVNNDDYAEMSDEEYFTFFKEMYFESRKKISEVDCCLVLNFDKNKNNIVYKNYIGASTFLEMYEAFMSNKEIYIYNELPDKENMLYDEIKGFNPIIINKDLSKIKRKLD